MQKCKRGEIKGYANTVKEKYNVGHLSFIEKGRINVISKNSF